MGDILRLRAEAVPIGVKIEEAMRGYANWGRKMSLRLYKRPFQIQNWFEYGDLYVWAMPAEGWAEGSWSSYEVFFRGKLVFKFMAQHIDPMVIHIEKYRRGAWTELVDDALAVASQKVAERKDMAARLKRAQEVTEERERWGIEGD